METTRDIEKFKLAATAYLHNRGLGSLRGYGRYIGLERPTTMKKQPLVEEIVAVLCGEKTPQRTRRGAPIKNRFVDENDLREIERLQREYGVDNGRTSSVALGEDEQAPRGGATVVVKDGSGKTVATVTADSSVQVFVIASGEAYAVTEK